MATKAEIATKVAQALKVLETGATIDSDDSTIIQAKYDSRYKVLAAIDLVSWGSGDDIPTEAETPIVYLVAQDCLTEFHVPMDTVQLILAGASRAIMDLKNIEYVDYVPDEDGVRSF